MHHAHHNCSSSSDGRSRCFCTTVQVLLVVRLVCIDDSVQLQRQVLLVVGLVRARRDPGRKQTEKRGHVLDQTHEHDLAGGGLLVF